MKQAARVLEAIERGALTARDVQWITGIPKKAASARLSELAAGGLVRRSGIVRRAKGEGRHPSAYAVVRRAA